MENNDFQYILTYKYSQNHTEILFTYRRIKDGFNNNSDIRTFKTALKKILFRTSIIASKHADCITFKQ